MKWLLSVGALVGVSILVATFADWLAAERIEPRVLPAVPVHQVAVGTAPAAPPAGDSARPLPAWLTPGAPDEWKADDPPASVARRLRDAKDKRAFYVRAVAAGEQYMGMVEGSSCRMDIAEVAGRVFVNQYGPVPRERKEEIVAAIRARDWGKLGL